MIRAGRGDDGQPHPDPAKPDAGQSTDPSSGEHASSPQAAQADPPGQAEQAAPSSTVLTEDEPGGAGTANATKTDAATEDTADARGESPAGPSAGGGRWGAVRRALRHNWVRHLI